MFVLSVLALLLSSQGLASTAFFSIHTNLSGSSCQLLEVQKEDARSERLCPGPQGYRLVVIDSDDRESITVLSPEGKKFDLDFWDIVTRNFSSVGVKAEWRLIRQEDKSIPIALIVPVRAQKNYEDNSESTKDVSYLVIAKILDDQACVVAKIKSGPKATQEAQNAADHAAEMPCMKPL
jgi:hypothetical protein